MINLARGFYRTSAVLFILILLVAASSSVRVTAATLKTLFSYCPQQNCSDGREPNGAFVADSSGNLYGTTLAGGSNTDYGTVFELKRTGSRYEFRLLYSFCEQANCPDGGEPQAALIIDKAGSLYGTTGSGGANNGGTAFKLVPNARHTKWTLEQLYDFCSQANCADGRYVPAGLTYQGAEAGLPYDGTSPLFGTTYYGGNADMGGVAFQLIYLAGKTKRREKIIYTFCSVNPCLDGADPSGLTIDASGNLYGSTIQGGNAGGSAGTAFELSPKGTRYSETILHNFGGADGANPVGGLVMDAAGNLYGATQAGGGQNVGTVFEITPNSTNSETVLHSFCSRDGCTDGSTPWRGLSIDAQGILYGVTLNGGKFDVGVAYSLQGSRQVVLHSFCRKPNCADGGEPAGVTPIGSGTLIGATSLSGGNGYGGTLFELLP